MSRNKRRAPEKEVEIPVEATEETSVENKELAKANEELKKLQEDLDELYDLSGNLPLYDRVILTEYDRDGQIIIENIDMDRRDKECVSSIVSRRSGTAGN